MTVFIYINLIYILSISKTQRKIAKIHLKELSY